MLFKKLKNNRRWRGKLKYDIFKVTKNLLPSLILFTFTRLRPCNNRVLKGLVDQIDHGTYSKAWFLLYRFFYLFVEQLIKGRK